MPNLLIKAATTKSSFSVAQFSILQLVIDAYEFMVCLHVFRQTGPLQRVSCSVPVPVCHIKMETSRSVPCPRTQRASLPACSPHYLVCAERRAGKLRTPSLVDSTRKNELQVYRLRSGRFNYFAIAPLGCSFDSSHNYSTSIVFHKNCFVVTKNYCNERYDIQS